MTAAVESWTDDECRPIDGAGAGDTTRTRTRKSLGLAVVCGRLCHILGVSRVGIRRINALTDQKILERDNKGRNRVRARSVQEDKIDKRSPMGLPIDTK